MARLSQEERASLERGEQESGEPHYKLPETIRTDIDAT